MHYIIQINYLHAYIFNNQNQNLHFLGVNAGFLFNSFVASSSHNLAPLYFSFNFLICVSAWYEFDFNIKLRKNIVIRKNNNPNLYLNILKCISIPAQNLDNETIPSRKTNVTTLQSVHWSFHLHNLTAFVALFVSPIFT